MGKGRSHPAASRYLLAVMVACGLGCTGLPHDPEGTARRVQGGRLRVGLVEHPPWVVRAGGEPAGAEVELVREFAGELEATPEWVWGGEQEHMEALEHYQLDLVVGGLTADTPWKDSVGLTTAYFKDRILVGVPDRSPPGDLAGLQVAFKTGDVTGAYLKKNGAVPVPVPDLRRATGPVAAPEWQLEQLGLTPAGVELRTRKHVMAVPPGENGWLARLEEFLARQGDRVKGLLQQEASRP